MSPLKLASIDTKPNRGWNDESAHAVCTHFYKGNPVWNVLLYSTMNLTIQRTWKLRAAVKIHQRWRSDPAMVRSSAPLLCRVWSVPSKMYQDLQRSAPCCVEWASKCGPLPSKMNWSIWPSLLPSDHYHHYQDHTGKLRSEIWLLGHYGQISNV